MRFGGAALGVDVASFIGNAATPKFDLQGMQAINEGAKNQALSYGLSSEIANAGTSAAGMVKVADAQAGAIEAGGAAQAQSAIAGGIGSAVSGIAGGLSGMFSGGGGGGGGGGLVGGDYSSFLQNANMPNTWNVEPKFNWSNTQAMWRS